MRILSLGGGQQSTAVYLLAATGEIPAIDYAIFADTGEEVSWVHDTLKELAAFPGGAPIAIRTRMNSSGEPVSLSDNLIAGNEGRFASIPAFLKHKDVFVKGGKNAKGKQARQCTREFKIDIVNLYIRRELLRLEPGEAYKGKRIAQVFGFDFSEGMRIVRTKDWLAKTSFSKGDFPLWDMQWKRSDCVSYVKEILGHDVGPSACTFCPLVNNAFRRLVRDKDPAGHARACLIDSQLREPDCCSSRGLNAEMYVHPSMVPLGEVDLDEPDGLISFDQDCEGFCGH